MFYLTTIIDLISSKYILALNTVITLLNAAITIFLFIKHAKDIYNNHKGCKINDLRSYLIENTLIIEFELLNLLDRNLCFTKCLLGNLEPGILENIANNEFDKWVNSFSSSNKTKDSFFQKLDSIYIGESYSHLGEPMPKTLIKPGDSIHFHFVFNNLDKNKFPKKIFLNLGAKTRYVKFASHLSIEG